MSIFRNWLAKLRPKKPDDIWEAISIDDVEAVRKYLDGGMDVEERDVDGATLLANASIFGALKVARLLIERRADPNASEPGKGWRPLHFAAQNGDIPMVERLLKGGAEVDARDNYGNTPLSKAVYQSEGRGELIGLLRRHGANANAENNHGVSPIKLAYAIANFNTRQFFADLPEPTDSE